MNKFKKCLSGLFLSCFLAFGNVSGCYLEVQAFDWVAPEVLLPFDGALPYLMGLLGVFPKDDSFNPEQWKDDYISDLESQGFDVSDKSDFGEWVENISKGALDQTSIYWEKFKEWIISKSSGGTTNIGNLVPFCSSAADYLTNINTIIANADPVNYSAFTTINSFNSVYSFPTTSFIAIRQNVTYFYAFNPDDLTISYENGHSYFTINGYGYRFFTSSGSITSNMGPMLYMDNYTFNNFQISLDSRNNKIYCYNVPNVSLLSGITNSVANISFYDLSINSPFNIYDSSIIDKLSFALSDAISSAIPDVIPLPWDNVGANENDIDDEYDAILEGIQSGTLDVADAMEKIQSLLGLLTVSDTGKIYPENPDKPDETLDDKVEENQANGTFVLGGFEKVFPFCIPFDIYAFMTLLVAEPVAPVIRYPIYNPVTKENNEIVLDFSQWESVTVLFRYIFDFLFIIGLLLSARALIGGGDKA